MSRIYPNIHTRCRANLFPVHMRKLYRAGLLLGLFCLPGVVQADSFLQPLQQINTVAEASPESSRSYIHYGEVALLNASNQGDIANIGVLIGRHSIAIIDSGGSSFVAEQLLSEIQRISELPISHIIITHAHPDHWMGLPTLLEKTNAQLLVNHALVPALAQRMAKDIARLNDALGGETTQASHLSSFSLENYANRIQVVDEPVTVSIGGRDLRLSALPVSHTNHDLVLWDEINQTLWAGDMFFVDHVPTFEASLKGVLNSRNVIEAYSANLIVPGHGRPEPDWRGKWQKQWQYFAALMNGIRQQILDGVSLQSALVDAEQTISNKDASNNATSFGDWRLMETFHPRNVLRAYQESEWE
ncbi:MBL fold metallo-hydrolase [Candidatus Spongiihabitans sp.]|uniref:MBL fold metallo-hydrolase n=1 Tax=Candidatus Spongiihabitans sp. TaxID=3101308 RepID=UPI003C7C42E0